MNTGPKPNSPSSANLFSKRARAAAREAGDPSTTTSGLGRENDDFKKLSFKSSRVEDVTSKPAIVVGFKTEKGSVYTVNEDGTTVRDKTPRDDVGHEGDFGVKACSARTIYVESMEQAVSLSGAGMESPMGKGFHVLIRDGKASLLWWNKQKDRWTSPSAHRDIPFSETPGIGKYPVELWKPKQLDGIPSETVYSKQHAGNKIVEVLHSA